MSFISTIPIIGKIFDKTLDIIDKGIKDKDLANKLKKELESQKIETELKLREIETENRKGERKLLGKIIDRKALPITEFFYLYMFLIVFNGVIAPFMTALGLDFPPLAIPQELSEVIKVFCYSFFGYKGFKKIGGGFNVK
jgi:hypothetical protein